MRPKQVPFPLHTSNYASSKVACFCFWWEVICTGKVWNPTDNLLLVTQKYSAIFGDLSIMAGPDARNGQGKQAQEAMKVQCGLMHRHTCSWSYTHSLWNETVCCDRWGIKKVQSIPWLEVRPLLKAYFMATLCSALHFSQCGLQWCLTGGSPVKVTGL